MYVHLHAIRGDVCPVPSRKRWCRAYTSMQDKFWQHLLCSDPVLPHGSLLRCCYRLQQAMIIYVLTLKGTAAGITPFLWSSIPTPARSELQPR